MGRWDALKPDENTGNPKDRDHLSSCRTNREIPRKQNINTSRGSRQHSFEAELTKQLNLYHSDADEFEPGKVTNLLLKIQRASNEVRGSVGLLSLVTLLEINNTAIRKAAMRLIEEKVRDSKQVVKEKEITECVAILAKHVTLENGTSCLSLQCLTTLISFHAKELPAEDTTRNLIDPLILPELQRSTDIETTKFSICDTIQRLLADSRFASAILSPLVHDVTVEGEEVIITNATRIKLFQALQDLLFSESTSNLLKSKACLTLSTVVETLRKTHEPRHDSMVGDLDLEKLQLFLCQNLAPEHPLYRPTLVLLRELLRTYTQTKLCSLLLFPGAQRQSIIRSCRDQPCTHCCCAFSGASPFLSSVHKAISLTNSGLALECTAELVAALPLNFWMQRQPGNCNVTSGFHRKVVDSLICLIATARCAVIQKNECGNSLAQLCTNALLLIPWDDERLIKTGEELWSTLVTAFKQTHDGAIASVLISSMGGRVTPQGKLLPMVRPARVWLSRRECALSFLRSLLQDIQTGDGIPSSLDVFSAILRTRPESAIIVWEDFEMLLKDMTNGVHGQSGDCLSVLEAFLAGRQNFPSDDLLELEKSHIISKLTFSIFEASMKDDCVKNKCRLLQCYGCMTPADWDYLELDQGRLMAHFYGLLERCHDPKIEVRTTACRAVGEFCSSYLTLQRLSESSHKLRSTGIACEISRTMINVLKEYKNPPVRAMAIFSLGNLALAMHEHNAFELLSSATVVEITYLIHAALGELNDKVVSNSIRSLGHWGSILAYLYRTPAETNLAQSLIHVIEGLSLRVTRTLAMTSRERQTTMSWKERSAAKKHGWGASFSMGRVLTSIKTFDDSNLERAVLYAVEQLVLCIQDATLLPEKVVLAAISSLCALQPWQVIHFTCKSGLVGNALANCCHLVFADESRPRLREEGSRLLSLLLPCASISDATSVLKHLEVSPSLLESLYHWMVEKEMDGRAFEIFALGLQRPVLATVYDVSLEQRFASRSFLQYKKEQSMSLNSDSDGGDEL